MISVVVPIYNSESYLKECIDSLIAQTFHDIEIILVDDGSTDHSGEICESYQNSRIRAYHTANYGLSAARNLGLDHAKGDFIYFIDSDDWIEPDLLEKAINNINDADILCFSRTASYNGKEALIAHLRGEIGATVWSKLFRKECFTNIRFPDGRIHEDLATTYKLLYFSRRVNCVDLYKLYHYRYRPDSLSHKREERNVIDYWLAWKEMYFFCVDKVDSYYRHRILEHCAEAIARAVAWRNDLKPLVSQEWHEMATFAKIMFPCNVKRHFSFRLLCGIFLARYDNSLSYYIANCLYKLFRKRVKNVKHADGSISLLRDSGIS